MITILDDIYIYKYIEDKNTLLSMRRVFSRKPREKEWECVCARVRERIRWGRRISEERTHIIYKHINIKIIVFVGVIKTRWDTRTRACRRWDAYNRARGKDTHTLHTHIYRETHTHTHRDGDTHGREDTAHSRLCVKCIDSKEKWCIYVYILHIYILYVTQ